MKKKVPINKKECAYNNNYFYLNKSDIKTYDLLLCKI